MVIPRSWKNADAVAAMRDFLRQQPPRHAAVRDLMKELLSENPYSRRCAADLVRRVSARQPGILQKYADLLIDLAAELSDADWQPRGYIAQAAAQNLSTHAQRTRLESLVRTLLEDPRIAVRAMALETFATLAIAEPTLRDEAMLLLEHSRHGCCALGSRARRMLPLLLAAEKTARPNPPPSQARDLGAPQLHPKLRV
jgi:hypothetical protein